jgi:hypothetical protein
MDERTDLRDGRAAPGQEPATPILDSATLAAQPELDPRVVGKLGVLFVHGIGEQKEGETLSAFAEPILWWLREAIRGHGQRALTEPYSDAQASALEVLRTPSDGISVRYAALLPSRRLSASPAHALVEIRVSQSGSGQQVREWVFAESWWGEQVQPPPVFDLIRWLCSRAPWIALLHVAERARRSMRRAPTRGGRMARALLRIGTACIALPRAVVSFLFLASLAQAVLAAAWVVALLPIPMFRRYLSVILQRMTFILGDSYGLVANETQRAAILARFRSTFDWLGKHCEKVVIIAHSQGGAVVSEAIKEGTIPRPPLLITFGSGITKLSQLRLCELAHRWRLTAAAWIVPTMLSATLLWAWLGDGTGNQMLWPVVIALYLVGGACAVTGWAAWSATRQYPRPPKTLMGDAEHRWMDLYATHDPVPQGDLEDHLPGCMITSERVVNRRSVLTDHTTYWANRTEFVSRVASELCKESGLKGMPDLSSRAYRKALRHHRLTSTALSATLWTIVIGVLAVAFFRFEDLARLGGRLIEAMDAGPFASVAGTLEGTARAVGWLLADASGAPPPWYESLMHVCVAVLMLLLVAYLWWHIVVALLAKWDSVLLSDFLTKANTWGRRGTWLVWPFILLFLLTPLALAHAISFHGDPLLILRGAGALLGLLFVLGVAVAAYESITKDRVQ